MKGIRMDLPDPSMYATTTQVDLLVSDIHSLFVSVIAVFLFPQRNLDSLSRLSLRYTQTPNTAPCHDTNMFQETTTETAIRPSHHSPRNKSLSPENTETHEEGELDPETEPDPEPEYPGKFKPTLIVFAIALAMFLLGLDCTIFSTAIVKVTEKFHALADVGWYASGYMLTFCAFQLTWGKVYTFCSIRWTYLVALFLFGLGSIICAVVPSSLVLILERAIAGVGNGGTSVDASQAVNRDESHVTVPKRVFKDRRVWADAIFGASIIGPFFIMLYYVRETISSLSKQ